MFETAQRDRRQKRDRHLADRQDCVLARKVKGSFSPAEVICLGEKLVQPFIGQGEGLEWGDCSSHGSYVQFCSLSFLNCVTL